MQAATVDTGLVDLSGFRSAGSVRCAHEWAYVNRKFWVCLECREWHHRSEVREGCFDGGGHELAWRNPKWSDCPKCGMFYANEE